MSSVKETPAYWKQFLYDIRAIVKQLGIPTYFLTLSCAVLRWEEIPYVINKLNNLGLSDKELKNLSYQERCNLLNNNWVLVARHFQYKVEVFFKEIILDGPLEKTRYYAIRIEFQERDSPHVHSFIWIFNALNIENEAAYIDFIEKTINAQLSDHFNGPKLFELILRLIKFLLTQEPAGKTTRVNVASLMVVILLRRQLLQNHLIINLARRKSKRF